MTDTLSVSVTRLHFQEEIQRNRPVTNSYSSRKENVRLVTNRVKA
jgi:hypothetical protein